MKIMNGETKIMITTDKNISLLIFIYVDTSSSSGKIVIIIIHFVKWKIINHDPV